MTSDRKAPQGPASIERQAQREAQREAKLAQALRANLRRRKAEPGRPGAAADSPGDDST